MIVINDRREKNIKIIMREMASILRVLWRKNGKSLNVNSVAIIKLNYRLMGLRRKIWRKTPSEIGTFVVPECSCKKNIKIVPIFDGSMFAKNEKRSNAKRKLQNKRKK